MLFRSADAELFPQFRLRRQLTADFQSSFADQTDQLFLDHFGLLCTDFFDQFMDENNLWGIALSDAPDEEILQHFMHAQLPDALIADFFTFFEAISAPIAVRSSSLLEDSHYQPFAGIYSSLRLTVSLVRL